MNSIKTYIDECINLGVTMNQLGECPKCNSDVNDQGKLCKCANNDCDFVIWKNVAQHELNTSEIQALLKDKKTPMINTFVSKTGNTFSAFLVFDQDFKTKFEFENKSEIIGKCPKCNSDIADQEKLCKCANHDCDFVIWKSVAQHELNTSEIQALLKNRKTPMINTFVSKTGNKFSAFLVFDQDFKTKFEFENKSEIIGKCPKCNSDIIDQGKLCKCANHDCDFVIWKNVAQHELNTSEIQALLKNRKTPMINTFVSKTGNKFSAFLVFDQDFKTKFEFENNKNNNPS